MNEELDEELDGERTKSGRRVGQRVGRRADGKGMENGKRKMENGGILLCYFLVNGLHVGVAEEVGECFYYIDYLSFLQ